MEFTRDYAMYAAIFGFFSMAWFGWAQENPPKKWRMWLGAGSVLATLTALLGIYLAISNWDAASALNARADFVAFGITVGIEFSLAGIGAAVLAAKNKAAYISAWIAFVVGVHFLPLVVIFEDAWLYLLTALTVAGPVVAIIISRKAGIAVSAVTGVIMGIVLLIFALRGLLLFF